MKQTLLLVTFLAIFGGCSGRSVENADSIPEDTDTELRLGAERMDYYLPLLADKRVAIAVNHTSTVGDTHLVDTLMASGVNIKKVFAPEHGFRGAQEAGELVNSEIDPDTGLPIVSLYGSSKKPTKEQLEDVDVIIFDIQDVGARFFTYISTMHYLMEACAENGKTMWVFDRPNPNGDYVDGPILEPEHESFIGMHPIPVVHGLTVAELATMINGEKWLEGEESCQLEIVTMDNYHHQMVYKPPIKPSPNLPTYQSIRLYPSLCFFERTPISLGRGTHFPFQVYGNPEFDKSLFSFTPEAIPGMDNNPKHKDLACYGWDLREIDPPKLTLKYLLEAYEIYQDKDNFFLNGFNLRSGNSTLMDQMKEGMKEEEIRKTWAPGLEQYGAMREQYLLYPEFAQ